jgi:O-antigen/teichoic acid export membrane protein
MLGIALGAFLFVLAVAAVAISIAMLRRGELYHRLKPENRPRRWVLLSMLVLFAVFLVWFPVWITWPHALISHLLTLLFGVAFFLVCMTFRWFSGTVDAYIARKGWPLR